MRGKVKRGEKEGEVKRKGGTDRVMQRGREGELGRVGDGGGG